MGLEPGTTKDEIRAMPGELERGDNGIIYSVRKLVHSSRVGNLKRALGSVLMPGEEEGRLGVWARHHVDLALGDRRRRDRGDRIVAVTLFGALLGVLGALTAVPLAAMIQIFVRR